MFAGVGLIAAATLVGTTLVYGILWLALRLALGVSIIPFNLSAIALCMLLSCVYAIYPVLSVFRRVQKYKKSK